MRRYPRHYFYLGEPEQITGESGMYVRRMASVYVFPPDSDYLKSPDDCVGVYASMLCGDKSTKGTTRFVTNSLVESLVDMAIVKGTRIMGVDK